MNVDLLEVAALALGDLRVRVAFLGGAAIALWMTDPASRRPRITYDVDVVAEVVSLAEYEAFQGGLREQGFSEDVEGGVICRWRHVERAPSFSTPSHSSLGWSASAAVGWGRRLRRRLTIGFPPAS